MANAMKKMKLGRRIESVQGGRDREHEMFSTSVRR
jgi:hypothetical protein